MKKALAILLVVITCGLVCVSALGETSSEDEIISNAVEALTTFWSGEIYQGSDNIGWDGHLEIKYTRVVYIKDELDEDLPDAADELFGNMGCFVEFMLLSDYSGSAPYYGRAGIYECVSFSKDGTIEVLKQNPLDSYRTRSYTFDFSGIIESISDRNADFNESFSLLEG